MRVEKKTKHLHIEFIVTSHNSVVRKMPKNANIICECSLFSLVLISEWCGKIYEHADYKGWEHVLIEDFYVAYFTNSPTAWKNDRVSSAKVKDGCTLKLYKHSHHGRFVETYSIFFSI